MRSLLHNLLRDVSIKYKIVIIIIFTSGISLAIAAAAVITFDIQSYKSSLVDELAVEADIIAANSTAALTFEDYDAARETLSALRHEDRIVLAYLLSHEGLHFGEYVRPDVRSTHRKPLLRDEGHVFSGNLLAVRRRIEFDGELLGHIYIEADLHELSVRVSNFIIAVSSISGLALIIVLLLTSRLQGLVSVPILRMAEAAKRISREKDYTVRAEKLGNDEVGELTDGFNEMLAQIQDRDAKLEQHRHQLEAEVGVRTAELRELNLRLKESELRIRAIVEGTASSTGVEFFDALVKTLARALEMRWVMVSRFRGDGRVQALAMWDGQDVVHDVTYELEGTPCEEALNSGYYQCHDDVAVAFPNDTMLQDWKIRSYVGLVLRDSSGRAIGLLNAFHDVPLPAPATDESMLRVYASRAAAELERLRVEAELQRSESSTRAILDSAADGIIAISANGVVETFNSSAEQIFKCSADEAVGSSVAKLMRFPNDDQRQQQLEAHPEAILARKVGTRSELDGVRSDGSLFPMNIAVSEVCLGDEIAYTAIVRDVTREHELDQMKSDFISTVSHEIRTPLAAIVQSARILTKTGGRKPTVVRKFSDIILDEGRRLTRLINDLLDLSTLDSGNTQWAVADASPRDLVEKAGAMTTTRALEDGIDLSIRVEPDLPRVYVDSDRVLEVLANLVDNAAKFTKSGGSIEVSAEHYDQGFVCIAVKDTGLGIAPEDQQHVFDRFKQIGCVLTNKPQGTGLGLAICREIVEYLGGKIWVESTLGEGSCFRFTLPIAGRTAASRAAGDSAANSDGVDGDGDENQDDPSKARPIVLVVDDDEAIRNVLTYLLEANGFRVVEASRGEEALTMAQQFRPALITLDIMMPDISGYDVLREMRADDSLKHIPVLLLSVLAGRKHAAKGLTLGANAYLSKPVDETMLIDTVNRLLEENSRNVLVINDDLTQSSHVRANLQARGYSVAQAFDARSGLGVAQRTLPDLIILGSPSGALKVDALLGQLREDSKTENIPVVLLTGPRFDDDNAVYFDGTDQGQPTARGDVDQLLSMAVERYATRESLEQARAALSVDEDGDDKPRDQKSKPVH